MKGEWSCEIATGPFKVSRSGINTRYDRIQALAMLGRIFLLIDQRHLLHNIGQAGKLLLTMETSFQLEIVHCKRRSASKPNTPARDRRTTLFRTSFYICHLIHKFILRYTWVGIPFLEFCLVLMTSAVESRYTRERLPVSRI